MKHLASLSRILLREEIFTAAHLCSSRLKDVPALRSPFGSYSMVPEFYPNLLYAATKTRVDCIYSDGDFYRHRQCGIQSCLLPGLNSLSSILQ